MARKQQRRANGEGTVTRRKDGRYEVREPRHMDADGRVHQRSFYGRTAKEALEKRAEAMRMADAGMTMDAQKTTLGEYIDRWLERKARPPTRPNTIHAYRHALALAKPIRSVALAKIKPHTVKQLDEHLVEAGVSVAMRHKVRSKLSSVMRSAVVDGLVPTNPVALLERMKLPAPKTRVWTEAQLLAFLTTLPYDTQAHAMFYVLAFTGLRRGELLGLHWSDFETLADGTGLLSVTRSVVPNRGTTFAVNPPKTDKSSRKVTITPDVVAVLGQQRARVDELRTARAELWQGGAAIFPSTVGTYMDPRNLNRTFSKWLKLAPVPAIRIHDLRHTHVSHLVARGHDAGVVADRLGHENVAFTLQRYRKLFEDQRQGAAFGIEDLLRAQRDARPVTEQVAPPN